MNLGRRAVAHSVPWALVAVVVTACGATTPALTTPSAPTSPAVTPATGSGGSSPAAVPDPPAVDGHPAAGLALVRFPEAGSSVSHVFVVEDDGALRQVTGVDRPDSPGAALPAWAPDGTRIAFAPPKVTGGEESLMIVDVDGGGERPFAALQDEYDGLHLDWSVDGSSVLYFDLHPFDGPMMWLADVATGDVRPLGAGSEPRWLPDGRIAFTGSVEGEGDPAPIIPVIYVMGLATGERTEIARASAAAWAPDGASVLIQADEDELVMADADGSNPTPFVNGWSPVWSPDGSSVVFAYDHNADGLPLLAAVDREGRRLWSGVIGESAAWSADGTRLAVEIRYPEPTVRVIDARTGDMLWETDGSQPAWRP